ncbi:acyl-CoA dehydrogenase family protein, partial [Escherichia coli]|uniref:acyl-CoA dehydrogenase family protein n=1 Tax=Escherichia coli TaxID=562 RepID=UPI00116C1132
AQDATRAFVQAEIAPHAAAWDKTHHFPAEQLKGLFGQIGAGQKKTRKLKIGEAMKLLVDEEAAKLVNEEEIRSA